MILPLENLFTSIALTYPYSRQVIYPTASFFGWIVFI